MSRMVSIDSVTRGCALGVSRPSAVMSRPKASMYRWATSSDGSPLSTPEDLRREMAKLIVEMDDEGINKKMAKQIGKGKPHEKVFAIYATAGNDDPKFLKKVRKGLSDKDVDVKRATAEVLVERRDKESIPDLEKLLKKKKPADITIAIEAIGAIQGPSEDWTEKMRKFAENEDRNVRNAALEQLAVAKDSETLLKAIDHEDWATRIVALKGLEKLRSKQAVPALISRLPEERGRMAASFADTLWSLTGQPFDEDADAWKGWWEKAQPSFEVPSEKEVAAALEKREMQRLKSRTSTPAQFFGIRIQSERVIFILDVSGSMLQEVAGRYESKGGGTRIDVAKRELTKCIEDLEPTALFNVLAFSSGVQPWLKKGMGGKPGKGTTKEAAFTFIERLGAGGATNLYDTIKLAFDDSEVDTIVILSDGEPTAGAVIDPHTIREDVKYWNRHRAIEIHTIAVGGNLEVLEWLAEDGGGRHVSIR